MFGLCWHVVKYIFIFKIKGQLIFSYNFRYFDFTDQGTFTRKRKKKNHTQNGRIKVRFYFFPSFWNEFLLFFGFSKEINLLGEKHIKNIGVVFSLHRITFCCIFYFFQNRYQIYWNAFWCSNTVEPIEKNWKFKSFVHLWPNKYSQQYRYHDFFFNWGAKRRKFFLMLFHHETWRYCGILIG